jgi:hypothetical protein
MSEFETKSGSRWYRSAAGWVVVGVDLLMLAALVAGTTSVAGAFLAAVGAPAWTATVTVPPYVYLYAVLGATGYVFTMLVRNFDRSAGDLARYNLRPIAALPLAAGVYLLSDRLVGPAATELLAGLSFVTGLFVNTAYLRIRDLAVRLLSADRAGATRGDESESMRDAGADGDAAAEDGDQWHRPDDDRRTPDPGRGPD